MYKGVKIRIYPDKDQECKLFNHIDSCRFVWNFLLENNEKNYKENGKYNSWIDNMKKIASIKKLEEYSWLNDISSRSTDAICKDLHFAYMMFFNKICGHPKFKSKKCPKKSFPVSSRSIFFKNGLVTIEKIGKIRYKTDINIPNGVRGIFYNARISYSKCDDKWFLSVSIKCDNQALDLTNENMGIDLGVKQLAVVAFNNGKFIFHNINKSNKVLKLKNKINYYNMLISRSYRKNNKRTKNMEKNIIKLEKAHNKICNINKNYIHQVTHNLVNMRPRCVIMEDLDVLDMIRNSDVGKQIADQRFTMFRKIMKYKCENCGIKFILADRYYPSSKKCSRCGKLKSDLKLKDRIYVCECGLNIDRDYNAALNLSRYVE